MASELEDGHIGEEAHAFAIALEEMGGGLIGGGVFDVGGAAGKEEAGAEAFDVPLEGTAEGFVEVVDVEDEVSVDAGIGAEVADVGVAAELGDDAAVGKARKVVGHDGDGSAEKAEGGGGHEPVAKGEEARETAAQAFAEEGEGVAMAQAGVPGSVLRAGMLFAEFAAERVEVFGGTRLHASMVRVWEGAAIVWIEPA